MIFNKNNLSSLNQVNKISKKTNVNLEETLTSIQNKNIIHDSNEEQPTKSSGSTLAVSNGGMKK
jgi:hypothetical protein